MSEGFDHYLHLSYDQLSSSIIKQQNQYSKNKNNTTNNDIDFVNLNDSKMDIKEAKKIKGYEDLIEEIVEQR